MTLNAEQSPTKAPSTRRPTPAPTAAPATRKPTKVRCIQNKILDLTFRTRFSLAEILVLAGAAGAGGMAPPASTRIAGKAETSSGTQFTREC